MCTSNSVRIELSTLSKWRGGLPHTPPAARQSVRVRTRAKVSSERPEDHKEHNEDESAGNQRDGHFLKQISREVAQQNRNLANKRVRQLRNAMFVGEIVGS